MECVADLHVHSKFSRGCSKNLDLQALATGAERKGVTLVGTGDFTHPAWFKELDLQLEEVSPGWFHLRNFKGQVSFLLTCEVSSVYAQAGRVRRIHYNLIFPSLESVSRFNERFSQWAKLASDGRPTTGRSVQEVAQLVWEIEPRAIIIPAHIWTPWYSLYGSMSGFDSIEEAFGDLVKYIYAVETGLSSDPEMNWRLSELDGFQIVSFSDAHSGHPHRIGREATIFELKEASFESLAQALRAPTKDNCILSTIEFYPEEGRYHFDGHRLCGVRFSPKQSQEQKYLCSSCGGKITVGVLSRVEALADRPIGYRPPDRPTFHRLVPLAEIIAQVFHTQPTSKKVIAIYDKLISFAGNELAIVLGRIPTQSLPVESKISQAIEQMINGQLSIEPGFDGEYGRVHLLENTALVANSLFR